MKAVCLQLELKRQYWPTPLWYIKEVYATYPALPMHPDLTNSEGFHLLAEGGISNE